MISFFNCINMILRFILISYPFACYFRVIAQFLSLQAPYFVSGGTVGDTSYFTSICVHSFFVNLIFYLDNVVCREVINFH